MNISAEEPATHTGNKSKSQHYWDTQAKTRVLTDQEALEKGFDISSGKPITETKFDSPNTPEEAFQLMLNWSAQICFEYEVKEFKKIYGEGNKRLLQDELAKLKEFIDLAERENTTIAFKRNAWEELITVDNEQHEYLRLKYGRYNDHMIETGVRLPAKVYGKYFLYKKWLEFQLQKTLTDEEAQQSLDSSIVEQHRLTLNQIALLHFYEGKSIDPNNSNDIAQKYGYTSGHKLYQHFNYFSIRLHRITSGETSRKQKNKLKLFESVIAMLENNKEAKKMATEDMNTFIAAFDNQY